MTVCRLIGASSSQSMMLQSSLYLHVSCHYCNLLFILRANCPLRVSYYPFPLLITSSTPPFVSSPSSTFSLILLLLSPPPPSLTSASFSLLLLLLSVLLPFLSHYALVKGSHALIVPYVGHVLGSLMKLLNDPSSSVVGAALSTIGMRI